MSSQLLIAEFNKKYITSNEIVDALGVERSCVLRARTSGLLPNSFKVAGLRSYLWEREPLQEYLNAWKITLASRRGELK